MTTGFLLVLEFGEASQLVPGWPEERLLVAKVGEHDEILSVEALSEIDLAVGLRGPWPPAVHPSRDGSRTVGLAFAREAAIVAAAVSAARSTLARLDDPASVPTSAPPGLPIDERAARASGMTEGSLLRLVAGPEGGLILVPASEGPPRRRIPWMLRDVAMAAALLGAFAAGLLA